MPPAARRRATAASGVSQRLDVAVEARREAAKLGERQLSSCLPRLQAVADERADDAVRLAERHALLDEKVGELGGEQEAARRAARMRSRVEAQPRQHGRERAQRGERRVRRVEHRLLVLLEVAVVGERQALHHRQHGDAGCRRCGRLLPRTSSATSGFFFCGMIELPVENSSGNSTKPNSAVAQSIRSAQSRERCTKRIDVGGEKLGDEVAIGDGVDRVLRDAVKAELARDERAIDREGHAGERARAERHHVDARAAIGEALIVASEHLVVGEQ